MRGHLGYRSHKAWTAIRSRPSRAAGAYFVDRSVMLFQGSNPYAEPRSGLAAMKSFVRSSGLSKSPPKPVRFALQTIEARATFLHTPVRVSTSNGGRDARSLFVRTITRYNIESATGARKEISDQLTDAAARRQGRSVFQIGERVARPEVLGWA